MPPNKLKNGWGDGVCMVLHKLCEVSLQNKFRFKKPVIRDDAGGMDEEAEEMGDEMEGGQDIADIGNQQLDSDDDDIADFGDFGGAKN